MSEPDVAAQLYVSLGRLVRSLRQESTAGSHVGPGGLSVLVTLQRGDDMRLGELAEHEGVSAASMTRIVQSLEAMSLVSRRADPADGRAQVLTITPAGSKLITSGTEAKMGALRRRIDALPETERALLAGAMPAFEALCALPV